MHWKRSHSPRVCGAATGLVQSQGAASARGDGAAVDALSRRLSGWAAMGWLTVLLLGAWPVARYAWITGGASLFGGT